MRVQGLGGDAWRYGCVQTLTASCSCRCLGSANYFSDVSLSRCVRWERTGREDETKEKSWHAQPEVWLGGRDGIEWVHWVLGLDWIGSHQQPSLSWWTALRVRACVRASVQCNAVGGLPVDKVMSDPPYHASTKSCRVNGLPTRPHHTLVIRWRWVMMLISVQIRLFCGH